MYFSIIQGSSLDSKFDSQPPIHFGKKTHSIHSFRNDVQHLLWLIDSSKSPKFPNCMFLPQNSNGIICEGINSWQFLFIIGKGETMAEPQGEILTLDEVAAYLKAGKRTVYRLAAEGKLPAFKLGGTWRFRRSDLDKWIAANLTNKDSGASD